MKFSRKLKYSSAQESHTYSKVRSLAVDTRTVVQHLSTCDIPLNEQLLFMIGLDQDTTASFG
jgi:hypothetical protein